MLVEIKWKFLDRLTFMPCEQNSIFFYVNFYFRTIHWDTGSLKGSMEMSRSRQLVIMRTQWCLFDCCSVIFQLFRTWPPEWDRFVLLSSIHCDKLLVVFLLRSVPIKNFWEGTEGRDKREIENFLTLKKGSSLPYNKFKKA